MPIARLLTPRVALWRYTLEAWAFALVPSLLVTIAAVGLVYILGDIDAVRFPPPPVSTVFDVLGAVVIAPIIETLLLALLITLLSRMLHKPISVAVVAGLIWGALHAIVAPLWFFGTAWAFFVYASAYLAWRGRSFGSGFVAAAVPHALKNMTATVLSVA